MVSISTEAKVGLFVLVALIILGYMSFRVGQYGFGLKKGYTVEAVFDNVAGLNRDADVMIAGVTVGKVESIGLRDGRAQVTLRIESNVRLEKDVIASIKTHGILGDKYVEIIPGTKGEAWLEQGGEIDRVQRQADMDKLLLELGNIANDVMSVTASLKKVLGGEEGEANLQRIISNTRDLTENLNNLVKQNDEKFHIMVSSFTRASEGMEKTFAALSEITGKINKGEGTFGRLVNDESVFEHLDKTVASLNEITAKINEGKGSIGKLVNDEETVDTLNASLKSIDKGMEGISNFVSKADQFRTFLSYRGEYLFDSGDGKGYLELKLQPKEDKFYILGVVTDPQGKRKTIESTTGGVTTVTNEWDRSQILFNAEIGKRFRDVVLRGGLLESTGGVGIDYFAFDDRLKLTFEAFDFDRDRDPHLKAYGEYRLFKHIFLSAGWDNFMRGGDDSSPFVGLGIRFEDEDLKYLLSSAPLPTK